MTEMISVLILKGSSNSLIDAEAWIRNRGWRVKSVTDMREALEYCVKAHPQYILIAIDHPNKKVKVLPKLIQQSLTVKVVMIAENNAPSSILTLQALSHPHLIFPPVTGAAIERTLLKMRKTEAEEAREAERQRIMASYSGTNEKSRPGFFVARGAAAEKPLPVMESEHIRRERSSHSLEPTSFPEERHQSLMVRGAVAAIDAAVHFDTNLVLREGGVARIAVATDVTCITVDSPRFSGYLVAAMGSNRRIDQSFMEIVKVRLFDFLRANGEKPKEEDVLGITIQEVRFEAWALEHAEFLRKTIHGADEVAMAFFPREHASVRIEASADESMVKISIDEIDESAPLEFDVYIYMPVNKRYVLYGQQGAPLPASQKSRLREKGIRHMHLRREAVADVKRYRAQNYLNARIEEFRRSEARAM